MNYLWLFIPFFTAFLYRMNGGNSAKKIWLYVGMASISYFALQDIKDAAIFMLIVLADTIPPTQTLFSAGHGRFPQRIDKWPWYPMQWLALASSTDAYVVGLIYGYLRGTITILAVVCCVFFYGEPLKTSPAAIFSAIFSFTGFIYFLCGKYQRSIEMPEPFFVALAELIRGWWMGTFLLIYGMSL